MSKILILVALFVASTYANASLEPIGHIVTIENGLVQYGVGTLIEQDLIVTAAHVVKMAGKDPQAIVFAINNEKFLCQIVGISTEHDLAFLKLNGKPAVTPAKVTDNAEGKQITVKYLKNLETDTPKEVIIRPSYCQSQSVWAELPAGEMLIPGNSGSPVYADGKLYAVLKGIQKTDCISAYWDRVRFSGKFMPNQVIALTTVATSEDINLKRAFTKQSWKNLALIPLIGFGGFYFIHKRRKKNL